MFLKRQNHQNRNFKSSNKKYETPPRNNKENIKKAQSLAGGRRKIKNCYQSKQ